MKKLLWMLLFGSWLVWPVSYVHAEFTEIARQPADKAQSGAAAANDARIYTAQLRRCEGLRPERKLACVEAAKR